ncbi:hypothetical protein E8E14_010237 [Neopestalotiopsis sp. 37M]|nr:hypothetical protein E8E14_010237 [Neopestalotiopsis sp. 37M]
MDPPQKRQRLDPPPQNVPSQSTFTDAYENDLLSNFDGSGISNAGSYFHIAGNIHINSSLLPPTANENRQVLLESLRFDQIDTRHDSIKRAHAKTCRWFPETDVYKKWEGTDLSDVNNFLWIKGKPGAGKSTLMKFLHSQIHARTRRKNKNELLISFFFNARGHELEKSTFGLYRSLLWQLLDKNPDLHYVLDGLRPGYQWTDERLKSLIEETIQDLGDTPIFCLIDALDECAQDQIRNMVVFLEALVDVQSSLHVCFASRHYPHITVQTSHEIILEERDGHEKDIASYLSSALRISPKVLFEQIRSEMQAKAHGVFMWVVLVVDILNKEFDSGRRYKLQERLQQLPGDLYMLFRDILTRDNNNRDGLLLCIQWILFGKEPLTPKQLHLAILSGTEPIVLHHYHSEPLVEEDVQRYILDNSKGLAQSTRSKVPTVRFIHESARDFLLKENGLSELFDDFWSNGSNIYGESHETLKNCCLNYMTMESLMKLETSSHSKVIQEFPFLEYANSGLLYHGNEAGLHGINQDGFLATFPRSQWVKQRNAIEKFESRKYTSTVSLLYILAEAGMPHLIRAHSGRQSCFEIENERYGVPILAALALEHDTTVEVMLELQAEQAQGFNFSDFCERFRVMETKPHRPSRAFEFRQNRGLVEQLIEYGDDRISLFFLETTEHTSWATGVDLNALFLLACKFGRLGSATHLAQECTHSPSAVDEETPLHYASSYGVIQAAGILVNRGANMNAKSREGCTPLHHAVRACNLEVALLLIDRGADISATDNDGKTPLHDAARLGNYHITGLLLDHGADVAAVENDGKTPLYFASQNQYLDVAELLLVRGGDASTTANERDTPSLRPPQIGPASETTFHDSGVGTTIGSETVGKLIHTTMTSPQVMPKVEETDDIDECATIYSHHTVDSTDDRNKSYEEELVAELCHEVIPLNMGKRDLARVSRVSSSLPRILQIFAFKIAKEKRDKDSRDVMRFLLKHRGSISDKFQMKAHDILFPAVEESDQDLKVQTPPSPAMQYVDKVQNWNFETNDIYDPNMPLDSGIEAYKPVTNVEDDHDEGAEKEEEEILGDNPLRLAEDRISGLVHGSRAYQWMLTRLRHELEFAVPTESTIPRLSEAIFKKLNDKHHFSRESVPERIDVTFDTDWSPHTFFEEQEYGVPPEEAFTRALVLVGTTTQAEGLACGEYLLRQWPETAPAFIRVVQSVLMRPIVNLAEVTAPIAERLSDGTTLRASVHNGRFEFQASGHPDSVIEIGEQLLWIICALRSSEYDRAGTCEPHIEEVLITGRGKSLTADHSSLWASMRVELAAKPKLDELDESKSGACWKALFRNPLVVEGYPIPQLAGPHIIDPEPTYGLELSLSALTTLIQDSRLVSFMGTSESNLQIPNSTLDDDAVPEIELEKVTVGLSRYFTLNASFLIGCRDRPLNAPIEGDYDDNIWLMSQKFVVLYDVPEQRGFLVDGTTALLHLVQSSLFRYYNDRGSGIERNAIKLDNDPDLRLRSLRTLLSFENARMKLHSNLDEESIKIQTKEVSEESHPTANTNENTNPIKVTREVTSSANESWKHLKDRVNKIFFMLNPAFEMSCDKKFSIKLNQIGRLGKLKGYDFWKVASLETAGLLFTEAGPNSQGWLNLVHRISALTLFGRDFGDIIRHQDTSGTFMCLDWRSVPKGEGYLAMSNSTLKNIMERYTSQETLQIIHEVCEDSPWDPFGSCHEKHDGQKCDRRHFLVNSQEKKPLDSKLQLPEHGAIIIGHQSSKLSEPIRALINSIKGRHANEPLTKTTGNTGTTSLALSETDTNRKLPHSCRSVDMSSTTPRSTAAGSSIAENTSSGTTVDTKSDNAETSSATRHRHPPEDSALPNATDVQPSTLPGPRIHPKLPTGLEPGDFEASVTETTASNSQMDYLMTSPFPHQQSQVGVEASDTVEVGSPPTPSQLASNVDNNRVNSPGQNLLKRKATDMMQTFARRKK